MNRINALRFLQTMIDYFETGSKETDGTAKAIIEWDFEYLPVWQTEIKRLREAGDWTGLRAPEADIAAEALRFIQQEMKKLESPSTKGQQQT